MVARPVVIVVMCVGFFLILQTLVPKAMAQRKPSNGLRYMMENQRTHKRKNYMVQTARDREIKNIDNGLITYENELLDPDLPAFMFSADMNDVILLDKVETRSQKSGNIKFKRYSNQVIQDPPCTCNYSEQDLQLEPDTFPRSIKQRKCSAEPMQKSCPEPYGCKEIYYNMTILKKKGPLSDYSVNPPNDDIHDELKYRWYAVKMRISVGCLCTSDYITNNGSI